MGDYCSAQTGLEGIAGDGDPIDICVLSERTITHGDILVTAIPIGGMRMVDSNEADDKIIAVMGDDPVFGHITDVTGLPEGLVDRLVHYFLSYKDHPGSKRPRKVDIQDVYGRAEALKVIGLSLEDYIDHFDDPAKRMEKLLGELAR